MWNVTKLIAVDEKGNRVEIADGRRVTVTVNIDNGLRISRELLLEDAPPHLSVAVDDLLKIITD